MGIKDWLLHFIHWVGHPKSGDDHHRVMHMISHFLGVAFSASLIGHYRWKIGLYLVVAYPFIKEFFADGHLWRLVMGKETKEQLKDLEEDLLSNCLGWVGLLTWIT